MNPKKKIRDNMIVIVKSIIWERQDRKSTIPKLTSIEVQARKERMNFKMRRTS
jgi:hypothetical protein